METFLDYLYGGAKNLNASTGGSTNNKGQKTKPLLFTLSETGDSYQYNYCSFSTCREPNKYKAILGCQKYSKGTPCFTFATKKKIVWKNDQNPKGLKLRKELKHGRNHVAQLVKDAGYYNGDITLLRGFEAEVLTSSKSSSNTVTKKTVEVIKSQNKGNIVEQLEALSSLFKAGAITKKEYDKAKEKVLND